MLKTRKNNLQISNHLISFKIFVSVLFGIFGFVLNCLDIELFEHPNYNVNILLGLIFPYLISQAWGFRYGVLSALAGGCQTMWCLWYSDGYGFLYAVPVFTLWIAWHGYWADLRQKKQDIKWFYSPFAVEIPFRIFATLGFYTVFRFLVSFNPPFWDDSISWNYVELSWVNKVVLKHIITSYILILTSHVLLSLSFVRKFFKLPPLLNQKAGSTIYYSAFLVGLLLWVLDAFLGFILFNSSGKTFWEILILDTDSKDLLMRNLYIFVTLSASVFIVYFIKKIKLVEKYLRESRENLRITLESIGDGVITTDLQGRVVHMNPVAQHLTGWDIYKAKGQHVTEVFNIINDKTKEKAENPVEKTLKTGKITGLANHTVLISYDKTNYMIADSSSPIKNENGELFGVVLVFRDVTEKYEKDRQLNRMVKLESLGTIAGGIAHDFNNILSAVFGNIEVAEMCLDEKNEAVQYLKDAVSSVERARNLTDQLLTFSRGGAPLIEKIDTCKILNDVVCTNLKDSGINPVFELDKNLWSVAGDKTQLEQVFKNLLTNSIEAMEQKGSVYIKGSNIILDKNQNIYPGFSGYFVKITFADQGNGIPGDINDRIFDPYFTTKENGKGLGLSIVHSIVKKHGGRINFNSDSGQGAEFVILLPAYSSEDKANINKEAVNAEKSKLKILIIDDEEIIRTLGKRMVTKLGHYADSSPGCKEALKKYNNNLNTSNCYDLVIMDLTIPGDIGGKECVKLFLKSDPGAKVIVSSGYSSSDVLANYKDYGFSGCLQKPFSIKDLDKEVKTVLDS